MNVETIELDKNKSRVNGIRLKFQSEKKEKGEVNMTEQFKDCTIKGRTQTIKQVATVKPPNPKWMKTPPREAKCSA